MSSRVLAFIAEWKGSAGAERGNMHSSFIAFCEALDLPAPGKTGQDADHCFEKPLPDTTLDGANKCGPALQPQGHAPLLGPDGSAGPGGGAYGWPVDLGEADILTRLVALNAERRAEEKMGQVRWLRPGYQQKT